MVRKFAWVESLTSFLIFINLILIAEPYVKNLRKDAEITSTLQSLKSIQYGMLRYYQEFGTYPPSSQIYDMDSLKKTLSPYLENLDKISFYFLTYQGTIENYTLLIKIKEKVYQITEENEIKEIGAEK
jgi:hypothetical protein